MNSPFVMVIFGASGDLAKTKLIPALFSLFKQGILPPEFFIIGFARRAFSDMEFGQMFPEFAGESEWESFATHLSYQQGQFEDASGYEALIPRLAAFDKQLGACITRLFYLATPPTHYQDILRYLHGTKLSEGCGSHNAWASGDKQDMRKWTRIIVEKPFGRDLETSKALDKKLSEIFEERQIFRVDHYLGKETVQNMLAFRFANCIFEPVWNNEFIDHVQISWGEKKGIDGRGKFFDGVGMLRDVFQNHVMQLIAAVSMEQPKSFTKESVRDARAEAIRAIRAVGLDHVATHFVRAQYDGYKTTKDIAPDSKTETFLAAKLHVDTPRFTGVPFYIRVGKKMPKNSVTISVVFKQMCHLLFREYGCPEIGNVLTFYIQPNEGIGLRVIAKKPGQTLAMDSVNMHFTYKEGFGGRGQDAYEKVLLDIFAGDQMLFNRSDELESSWKFVSDVLTAWENDSTPIATYAPGTWGPEAANQLIEKDGKKWL